MLFSIQKQKILRLAQNDTDMLVILSGAKDLCSV